MRYALAGAALLSLIDCQYVAADRRAAGSVVRLPAEVTAILIDGRQITGRVAATTDDQRLDLIVASSRIAVTSHLSWQQVDSFSVNERQFSVDRFRKRLDRFLLPEPPVRHRQATLQPVVPLSHDPGHGHRHSKRGRVPDGDHEDSGTGMSALKAARAIQMDARIANWDSDPAADGLLLELYVLDENGQPLHVPGQLTAKLIGLRQQITGGQTTVGRQPPVADLESWSQPLRVANFADGVAIVKLPFRRLVPERDLDIAPGTLLQISYGVSSVGVFKASQPDVLIRRPSRFRDDLFLSTGNRVPPSGGRVTPRRSYVPATFDR